MSKKELMVAIRKLAEELGRTPGREELIKRGITRRMVAEHFGGHREAMKACKLRLSPYGRVLGMNELFEDWATIAREVKRLPSHAEFSKRSRHSSRPFINRFRFWSSVPAAMKQHMEDHGLAAEWADVMELIERTEGESAYQARLRTGVAAKILLDRPMYGTVLRSGPMVCAPTNENGVLVLFGAMAEKLGFLILRVQVGFPDVEAWRIVGPDRLQRVKIEVEYQSRNFVAHHHNAKGCDLIVCWEHNWPECPVEVIELKRLMEKQ
jgi:HNH endonuclease